MEARQVRGAQIVEKGGLTQRGDHLWIVPSQSHGGKWLVDYSSGTATCTCPDYEENSAFCKHIFAVEIHLGRLSMSDPKAPQKKRYTQDWAAYNLAQVNEEAHFYHLLHALCEGIVMKPQTGRGRPKTPLGDAVMACVLKVYAGTSGRRASGDIRRGHEGGYLSKHVAYNTVTDYLGDPEMTPLLRTLIQESAAPLAEVERAIAIDSSGFGTRNYDRWFDEKWGKTKSRQKFVKLHIATGTKTNVITDAIVHPGGDAPQFVPLLDGTTKRFKIEEVSADKAYLSKAIVNAVGAIGAVPYIPFKEGTGGGKKGPALWKKMYGYFMFNREDFDQHYHRRSNVETTFSMVKAKFGASVRAKSEVAQANELLCKVLAHNIVVLISAIYELELQPTFWKKEA